MKFRHNRSTTSLLAEDCKPDTSSI
uniref:Uncharacterized protein n=1 Tax=Arundo donax TaxID=35708 RepID=A0A0A9GTA6_ARUDO